MKLILDIMSGDNAPDEIVAGAIEFIKKTGSEDSLILVGKGDTIRPALSETLSPEELARTEVLEAGDVITMEDGAMSVREKPDSSMSVALRTLAEGKGEALVSAGNTGALYTGAVLTVKRVPGLKKAAMATVLPFKKPLLLLDCGANPTVDESTLLLFGVMGSLYMKEVLGVQNVRVGLLNNGTESHKGTETLKAAYKLFSESDTVNFVGNIEGKNVPNGECDVLVTDGFTGNVVLKLIEGLSSFFMKRLKKVYTKSIINKLSYIPVKGELKAMKNDFDASEYGGAPILGISKPIIKAHGSSDAREIYNALLAAGRFASTGLIGKFADMPGLKELPKFTFGN